ncbi:MAG: class I SAM-dependent methyltransferase [Tepidisphaeraceae bacterium]
MMVAGASRPAHVEPRWEDNWMERRRKGNGEVMTPSVSDKWGAGANYDEFMGRWSRALAPRFVSWLRVAKSTRWLDVGCGTGALTSAICEHADPETVLGCDPAAPLIGYARRQVHDVRASFVVAGVGSLPPHVKGYGSVASLFALNFFPDADAAIDEQRSLAVAEGTISACVWDYARGMMFLRYFWDVAATVDPGAREFDEAGRFPVCSPNKLVNLFEKAGLCDVRCEPIEIPTEFRSFDDYWQPFLGGTGPAPSYVASLDAHRRSALAAKLVRTLPTRSNGVIALTGLAWAVRGTVQ